MVKNYYRQILDIVCLRLASPEEAASDACKRAFNKEVLPPDVVCQKLGRHGPFDHFVIEGLVDEVWDKVGESEGEFLCPGLCEYG